MIIAVLALIVWLMHPQKKASEQNSQKRYADSEKRQRMFESVVHESVPAKQYEKVLLFLNDPLCTRDDILSLAYCLSGVVELTSCHKAVFEALRRYVIDPDLKKELFTLYSSLKHERDRDFVLDFACEGIQFECT